jgi:hypothetical protein
MNKQSILLIMVGISSMVWFNIWLAQRDTQMWDKMDQEMINICSNPQQTAPACDSYRTVHQTPQTTL